MEELDRSDEGNDLYQSKIVNLLLYTEESNSPMKMSRSESKQINFKDINRVEIFNCGKDEDSKSLFFCFLLYLRVRHTLCFLGVILAY